MLKFTSEADLLCLNPADSALPVLRNLVHRINTESQKAEFPYNPEHDGWIVLIDQDDLDRPLTEIWDDDAYHLIDVPWEGVTRDDSGQFFIGVYLANNQWGLIAVIPDADWLGGEHRECLEAHLVE